MMHLHDTPPSLVVYYGGGSMVDMLWCIYGCCDMLCYGTVSVICYGCVLRSRYVMHHHIYVYELSIRVISVVVYWLVLIQCVQKIVQFESAPK
jgi:hypothetical protein